MNLMRVRNYLNIEADQPVYSILIVALLLCLMPFLGAFVPRFFGYGPGVIALLGFTLWRIECGYWPVVKGWLVVGMGLIAGGVMLSSFWALDSEFAIERGVKVALVLVPLALLVSLALELRGAALRFVQLALPIMSALAGVVCVIDLYFEGAVYFLLHEVDPDVAEFNLSRVNRSVNIFALMCIPSFYALYSAGYGRCLKAFLGGALLLILGAVLCQTDSQSAQVALGLGLIGALVFPVRYRKVWMLAALLLAVIVALMPWSAQMMYIYLAEHVGGLGVWFRDSYIADRMEIWDFVSRKALESPIYGFGVEATRHIEEFDTPKMYTPHAHVLHPHNGIVQIWIEFGALGAAALAAFLAMIMRSMSALPRLCDRRLAVAVFAAMFFIANTAYGLWQGWWLGLMGYMAVMTVMLCHDNEEA